MATNEIQNGCGCSLEAASGLKGQKKMRQKDQHGDAIAKMSGLEGAANWRC
jgi:hypothetical protein